MDGNRFDDLSRRLAEGVSRRTALTRAAAALLGAIGLRQRAGAQVSVTQCNNVRCKNDPGRCFDGCVCCVFANGNNRCLPPDKCGLGTQICPEGEVVDPVLGCVPDEPACATDADCGDPCAVSCVEGTCSDTPALAKGAPCGDGSACLDGSCQAVSGGCTDATRCITLIACPSPTGCNDFPICQQTVEGAFVCTDFPGGGCDAFGTCVASADCDPGFVCIPDTCCLDGLCLPVCGAGTTSAATLRTASDGGVSPIP